MQTTTYQIPAENLDRLTSRRTDKKMTDNAALEALIVRWEERIEKNKTTRCSMAERARRNVVNTVYGLVIDELREIIKKDG